MSAAIERVRSRSLYVGLAASAACAVGAFFSPDRFFRSYLFGYLFWLGVALGCLAIVMIQHVTGGAWGLVLRRLLEAGARTLPLMAILFLFLLPGLESLYPWARPDEVARDELLAHKQIYLNVPFFIARAAIYFAAWIGLAQLLWLWSRRQDETGDERLVRRFQMLSAGGLLVFVLTMTFASVDWVMSLEPHWVSTIYAALLMAGQAVSALSFAIVAAILLAGEDPLSRAITPAHLHDLGKLLFAFVMIWAYFALSQFMIIWSGNLPEEIPWYLRRLRGGWQWVGLSVILLHFALPFLLLLSRGLKRAPGPLLKVAALVLVMRLADLYWMVVPSSVGSLAEAHWMDLAAPIAVGGLWIALFLKNLAGAPLLPSRDPYMKEALSLGHE